MINHQTWGGKHLHMVVKKKQSLIVHSRPESSKLLVLLGKKNTCWAWGIQFASQPRRPAGQRKTSIQV